MSSPISSLPPSQKKQKPLAQRFGFLKSNRAFKAALVILGITSACLVGMLAFVMVRQTALSAPGIGQLTGPNIVENASTPQVNEQGTPLPPEAPLPAVVPQTTPWDGAGRVTILLLGLDFRDWEAGDKYSRSDTMILLTLDPLTGSAGMLSIPRDMWVSIPGFKHGKINTAYYQGDAFKLPGGGPGLAVKTVEQFLGVPINYYAQIDFDAFVKFIDELGGVKVDVPNKITIDLLGSGPKTKKTLQPGVQVLPGAWALAYARQRYTEGGDFDRAQRQQQVILGIRDRILSLNMLPTLISKAPTLYQQLSAGIHTNLSLDESIKLALLAQQVPLEKIQREIIGKEQVIFGFSPDNLSILIPLPDKIQLLRDKVFATSSSLGPGTEGNSQQQMQAENARLAVLNGSSATDLGERTANYLRNQGVNVTQVSAADQNYAATTVIDHSGSPYLLKYLLETLKISPTRVQIDYNPNSPVDVEVYLGEDWARNNNLP